MDYLKKQLESIQLNLAGLNATQKMLTGALVVIIAMTMVYWSHYAGTAEMEPVLNQTLSDEDLTRMSTSLEARCMATNVESGKVLVAADRKMQALAALGYEQLLPRNTTSGFDLMMAKGGVFDSPDKNHALMNHAKELTLAQVIGAFPGVQNAVVMIDPTNTPRIGGGSVTPSANINISMQSGTGADGKLVNAAADLVCGAVANMNRAKIKVVVDGRPRQVSDGSDGELGSANDQLDAKNNYERSIQHKIEGQLSYINGVVVAVDGILNTSTEEERSTTNDEKNTLNLPQETETKSLETTTNTGSGGGEPGAVSNVGASVAGAGGGNSSSTTDTTERTKFQIIPASTQKTIKRPPGDYTTQSASVRVPRSYFVGVLKARNGGKEPADVDLQDYMKVALADIKATVRACTSIKKEDDIVVGTYDESAPMVASTSIATASVSGSGVTGLISGWGKEVGVGALAVISLFMVSTMVKRSTPAPIVVSAPSKAGPSALQAGEDVAGFASEGSSSLAGMELDDDAMQAQQVIDQVTSLVGENPDGAASLVKRWLNR
ncbi:hypothetical protein BH10PLA1_BH10PLA1_08910 [soil metagenome]